MLNDWYFEEIADGVVTTRPGIYEWRIEGVGVYIGQYTRPRRPRRHYARNVERLEAEKHYRLSNPNGFRAIHCALAAARRVGRRVVLAFVENVEDKLDRNRRERELIAERREAGLNVLNA